MRLHHFEPISGFSILPIGCRRYILLTEEKSKDPLCHLTNTRYDLVCLRMIYSMSDQFLELKMTLSSSNFSSSSRFFGRESQGDATSTSSDTTSTDSDFTFPAPASTPANFSSLNPGAFQLVVQDLSAAEMSG